MRFTLLPIFLILSITSSTAFAQEPDEEESDETTDVAPPEKEQKSVIRFSGVVQFVNGNVERVDASKARSTLAHRDPIYEDERLTVPASATLKIVTRDECIAVVHGEALALASNREKPWRLRAGAVRWICPEGKSEMFIAQNFRYQIKAGEVLIDGNKLMVVSGQLRASKSPQGGFAPRTLNVFENGAWKKSAEQTERANWEFNQNRKPPRESNAWNEPEAAKPPPETSNSRLILGLVAGGGNVGYDVDALDQKDLGGAGARLIFQRRDDKGGSSLYALTARSLGFRSDGSGMSGPRATSDLDIFLIEAGYRSNHDSTFSFFFKGGGGIVTSKIYVNRTDVGYRGEHDYDFYVGSLSIGVDAYVAPAWLGPLGLYASLEGQALASLARSERKVRFETNTGTYPDESKQPWFLTSGNLSLMLGLGFDF